MNRWLGIAVALAVSAAAWWLATGGEHGTSVDVLGVDGGAGDRAVEAPEASPAAVVDEVSPLDVAAPSDVDEPEESDDAARAREGMVVEVVDASGVLRPYVALAVYAQRSDVAKGVAPIVTAVTDATGHATIDRLEDAVITADAPDGTMSTIHDVWELLEQPPADLVRLQLERSRTVHLHVVDRLGRPVAGAIVTAEASTWRDAGDPREIPDTRTDAEGYATIVTHDAESLAVVAERASTSRTSWRRRPTTEIDLRTHDDGAVVSIELAETVVIRGHVLDVDDEPAVCEVRVAYEGGGFTALTDPSGAFEAPTFAVGTHELVATATAEAASSKPVDVEVVGLDAPPPVELRLRAPAWIEGVVLDADGVPLGDVSLSSLATDDTSDRQTADTDRDGTFRLGPHAHGSHAFVAWTVGDQRGSLDDLVPVGTSGPLEIRLDDLAPLTTLRGRLVAAPGTRFVRAEVRARLRRGPGEGPLPTKSTSVATDGSFTFDELVVGGTYDVSAWATDGTWAPSTTAEATIPSLPIEPAPLLLQLRQPMRVTVRLSRPARETIYLMHEHNGFAKLDTDSDGTATFQSVHAGRHRIHVGHMYEPIAAKAIVVTEGENLVVDVVLP